MTAVAPSSSIQTLPRLGWYDNDSQNSFTVTGADDVSVHPMSRKSVQRSNSLSSLTSSASSSNLLSQSHSNAGHLASDKTSKKKPFKYVWSGSKADPVSGVTNTRSQGVPASTSGTAAASAMSSLQQPSFVSQHNFQSQQQNGVRNDNRPPAVLSLVPANGTFEKKYISVPYYPDVLRIGRQTNAKTIPSPVNGYFDSKVLSRQHAEIWADGQGKIYIRDIKSSNGTFVNGHRLSPENRESDPHELREHDNLELGIDIISEDAKSIVHHKVAAKVENAGIYGQNNAFDLNFNDIDPSSGGGLFPSHLNQSSSLMRGRSGSNASLSSNRSVQTAANGHAGASQQRQINYWSTPVTIEQVVKRLTSEMKQAKQQSQDLSQTHTFLTSLISNDTHENERPKPSTVDTRHSLRMPNGRTRSGKFDSLPRTFEPPAPPPQQPLPEKPVFVRSPTSESLPRSKSMRLHNNDNPTDMSPAHRDSLSMVSLMEALTAARKDIELQATRMKELENLLAQERAARENAEKRYRVLESRTIDERSTIPSELSDFNENNVTLSNGDLSTDAGTLHPSDTSSDSSETPSDTTDDLKSRLENVYAQMEEMRKAVSHYRESADKAQLEAKESNRSLTEMVESLRRERSERTSKAAQQSPNSKLTKTNGTEFPAITKDAASTLVNGFRRSSSRDKRQESLSSGDSKASMSTWRRKRPALEQSAPYASILGVVLLGVGVMAYLNGWSRVDK